ncbi:MAG TPA: hypothetical protein VN372_11120 [Methanospirillum sp.]|nr:hypothetical protein [Methanospirillum sp.]
MAICVLLALLLVIGPVCALNIIVFEQSDRTAAIPEALIYTDGEYTARTDANGSYNLTYEGEPPVIRVTKAGYRDWSGTPVANDTLVLVPMQVRNCTLTVKVFDADTLLPAPGVHIRVGIDDNTIQEGYTNTEGSVILPLRAEQVYDLVITAKNYQTVRDNLVTGFDNTAMQYSLIRNDRISVQVKDLQDGNFVSDAIIRVDNHEAGKTNEHGIVITNLTRGTEHTIEAVAQGYEETRLQKMIGEDELIIDLSLVREKSPAFVSVYGTDKRPIEGAYVQINGNESGLTNQYGRLMVPDLEVGEYELSVSKDAYERSSRRLMISPDTQDIVFEIRPVRIEQLIWIQDPSGLPLPNATVVLNNVTKISADESGSVRLNLEPEKNYVLSASLTGYLPNNTTLSGKSADPIVLVLLPEEKKIEPYFPWVQVGIGIALILGVIVAVLFFLVGSRKRSGVSRRKKQMNKRRSL